MSPDEVEAAMYAAFNRCDAASCPLTDCQKEILLRIVEQVKGKFAANELDAANPLDELSSEELRAFLAFVKMQEQKNLSWKVQLLNDWLHDNDSGAVQFIRERYGLGWLDSIKAHHIYKYAIENALLKVGDRIEVCNALWEWVQEEGPCQREWFACMVIQVREENPESSTSSCVVRFENGSEYEIQGIYDWNQYNWRRTSVQNNN
ncbi:MAG: hypothetical protein KME64_44870 [Scytonematopsis contorta HA4267-MV1]|jgi:hypothetical protein|nr:hypothetical protein [Scytonematopsis contorta HA4267-MV1]